MECSRNNNIYESKVIQLCCQPSKSNPITGLNRTRGFQKVEVSIFQGNRHTKVVRLYASGSNSNSYAIPAQSDMCIYTYSSQYREDGRAKIKLDSSEYRVARTCEPQVRNPWLHVQGLSVMYHSVRSLWMREVQQVDSAHHLDPAPGSTRSALRHSSDSSSVIYHSWWLTDGGDLPCGMRFWWACWSVHVMYLVGHCRCQERLSAWWVYLDSR